MPGKRVTIDDETWTVLDLLARDRMATFQELADEAFADLLKKHGMALADLDVIEVDAGIEQAVHLDTTALVVTNAANVLHLHAEPRTSHHGAGDLAARTQDLFCERNLAGVGGKVRQK